MKTAEKPKTQERHYPQEKLMLVGFVGETGVDRLVKINRDQGLRVEQRTIPSEYPRPGWYVIIPNEKVAGNGTFTSIESGLYIYKGDIIYQVV